MTEILPPHIYNPSSVHQNRKKDRSGKIIAVEAIDGAGKSTLIAEAKRKLELKGLDVAIFKNHAGPTSPYWKSVKTSKNQLLENGIQLSRETDRALQAFEFLTYCRSILPILIYQFDVIFADRYTLSKIVYGRVELDSPTQAEDLIKVANDIPVPDITVFINVSIAIALSRIESRGGEKDWKEQPENLVKADNLYKRYLSQNNDIAILDGHNTVDELSDKLIQLYRELPS